MRATVDYLAGRYGDDLDISWRDVSRSGVPAELADIVRTAQERRWLFPLTIVDGEVRLSGALDYYGLDQLIREKCGACSPRATAPA